MYEEDGRSRQVVEAALEGEGVGVVAVVTLLSATKNSEFLFSFSSKQ